MSNTVLKIENISKQYRLGLVGTGTIKDDLTRWWYRMRGKEDPFLKVGDANDRTQTSNSDYVWALRDVNFEVEKGDTLGIIGRNGAGKSTLLKILSKVTQPTTGTIKTKGRIASLLEVGTGFHPELTGRENIYLNGAILGMRRKEIDRKLEEIIDFSGVERYIDTPVKRYSSGMYVRLAFGVAAHLESEVLIIDEVLAVGDAEFQKKCMGKMGDLSRGEGRTVLFVSHNMGAVKNLCNRSVLMANGTMVSIGDTPSIINQYMMLNQNQQSSYKFEYNKPPQATEIARLTRVWIEYEGNLTVNTPFSVCFEAEVFNREALLNYSFSLNSPLGQTVFNSLSQSVKAGSGIFVGKCQIPGQFMNNGLFQVTVVLALERSIGIQIANDIISFEITDERDEGETWFADISDHLIRPRLQWDIRI